MKTFTYIIIAIVAVSIIAGFFILGTPQAERMRRFDGQQVENLQSIQGMIINYWQAKEKLPVSLTSLIDEIQGVYPPIDPETKTEYDFSIIDEKNLTFELCAEFKTSNPDLANPQTPDRLGINPVIGKPIAQDWNWQHGVGLACFERTIDPDQYPPFNKTRN